MVGHDLLMGIVWGRSRPTDAEVAVAEAILQSSGDPRCEQLLSQFQRGPVDRSSGRNSLKVTLRQTTEDLLVDLDRDLDSRWVTVANASDGREVQFAVTLHRGGFFGSLAGRCEGRWPRRWTMDENQLSAASVGALNFDPEPLANRELVARILEVPNSVLGRATLRDPADPAVLDHVESRESQPLPPGCREVLLATDGLRIGTTVVLGSADLYAPELDQTAGAWLVGVLDDQTQVVARDSGIYALPEPRADLSNATRIASTYIEWIRTTLD